MSGLRFDKILEFLISRNLEHLQEAFIAFKIDNIVAGSLPFERLIQMGLVMGDALAFQRTFLNESEQKDNVLTYCEKSKS